ncbi:DUF6429 family protein [Thermodesulfobacteriota bacterium]
MEYNKDKVDEMALALVYLTTHEDHSVLRAWKSLDWDCMNRLFEKGYIGNPRSKAKSVTVSEEGARLSEELFKKHFGSPE